MSRKKLRSAAARDRSPVMPPVAPASSEGRPTTWEFAALAFILLVAIWIRCAYLSQAAVEHFDEGVYASNLWCSTGEYPLRHLYAPPLLPALVEWSCLLFGATHWGTLAVSLLAGCGTVASMWWIARQWFGGAAGLAAATLAGFSDFHAAFSRSALTDVLLLFWLLWAVYFLERAWRFERAGHVVLAGIATGLAWCTKYNGWLPLAIGITSLPLWLAVDRSQRPHVFRRVGVWFAVAIIAACLWCPVWSSLHDVGGYAAVAANHRKYVVGIAGWPESLARQWANLRHFDGWLTCVGAALAVVMASARHRSLVTWALAVSILAASAWLGASVVFAIASVAGIGGAVVELRRRGAAQEDVNWLPLCLVAVWFGAMFVATPMYNPYARLTLPWLAASWLCTALAIGEFSRRQAAIQNGQRKWAALVVLCAALVATAVTAPRLIAKNIPAWQSRTGLETIGWQIAKRIEITNNPNRVIVYVYGEPALFFHLCTAGLPNVGATGDLSFATAAKPPTDVEVFLVAGPHAESDAVFAELMRNVSQRFDEVATYSYTASDFVLLDRVDPRSLVPRDRRPGEPVRLWRLR